MIKNIVFDIGRVLLNFDPIAFLKCKFNDELIEKELYSAVFLSSEWLELDKGIITDDDAIEIFSKRHEKYSPHISQIIKEWHTILTPIEGTVETLYTLKNKGFKIYLLSNFHRSAFEKVYNRYEFLRLVDGRVVSSDVRLLKPNKVIYENLCESYLILPEESLFIDDTLENIKAAKELGFSTIHFENPEQLKTSLKALNLL